MTPFVVGTRDDVAGFALVGIEGAVCATREEAERAIAQVPKETLLLVSHELAAALPRERLGVVLAART